MDDSEARTKALVSTVISTLDQVSCVNVDAVLRSLKTYEVRVQGTSCCHKCLPRVFHQISPDFEDPWGEVSCTCESGNLETVHMPSLGRALQGCLQMLQL